MSSPRSGPQRRRTPVAHRQADDMLDIGAGGIRELAPAARARRGDALRNRGEAQAQQRRGAAVAGRTGRAARRGGAEGAARRRHGQAFEAPRGGNISLQGFARAGISATTVPAGSRDRRRVTPGALRFARVRALTRRGTRDRPRRSRKQVLRQGRHRNVLRRGKAANPGTRARCVGPILRTAGESDVR